MIMRPSLKQHVGLLPDDVSRCPKLSKSLSCVASLDSAQPLSSYHIDALASRLSPHTKDICRDKTTTKGKCQMVVAEYSGGFEVGNAEVVMVVDEEAIVPK